MYLYLDNILKMPRFILFLCLLICLTSCIKVDESDLIDVLQRICIDEDKIDEQAVCIEIYQPVCGCNAKTYSNTCYAKRAGLISWKDGECI
tara:strand:+ start:2475 stop:2747 length:273 start_codon:yes stop_codon:yes gene_type:complete